MVAQADVQFATTIAIPVATLRTIISSCIRAISTDTTREAINCLYIETVHGLNIIDVATDGHRLHKYETRLDGAPVAFRVCLPLATCKEVIRALKKVTVGEVAIDASGRVDIYSVGSFSFHPIDASRFPPFRQVISSADRDAKGVKSIGVNGHQLSDAQASFDDAYDRKRGVERIVCAFGGELDPVLVTAPEVPELTIVLMPSRI